MKGQHCRAVRVCIPLHTTCLPHLKRISARQRGGGVSLQLSERRQAQQAVRRVGAGYCCRLRLGALADHNSKVACMGRLVGGVRQAGDKQCRAREARRSRSVLRPPPPPHAHPAALPAACRAEPWRRPSCPLTGRPTRTASAPPSPPPAGTHVVGHGAGDSRAGGCRLGASTAGLQVTAVDHITHAPTSLVLEKPLPRIDCPPSAASTATCRPAQGGMPGQRMRTQGGEAHSSRARPNTAASPHAHSAHPPASCPHPTGPPAQRTRRAGGWLARSCPRRLQAGFVWGGDVAGMALGPPQRCGLQRRQASCIPRVRLPLCTASPAMPMTGKCSLEAWLSSRRLRITSRTSAVLNERPPPARPPKPSSSSGTGRPSAERSCSSAATASV